jgi:NADH:ubiquinone oxidoreductase subunit K
MPYPLLLSLHSLLFGIGLAILLTKRTILFSIVGIELMIQPAIANFIIFDSQQGTLQGQVFSILITVAATCEVVVLLALSLWIYQKTNSTDINNL